MSDKYDETIVLPCDCMHPRHSLVINLSSEYGVTFMLDMDPPRSFWKRVRLAWGFLFGRSMTVAEYIPSPESCVRIANEITDVPGWIWGGGLEESGEINGN